MSAPIAPSEDAAAIRRTILLLSVCGFASALSSRFVDPMVGAIARDVVADPHRVALLATAYALPYALIQPILGPIGDAIGKERIVKLLLAGLTLSLVGAALATDLTVLAIFRVLSGATAGGIIPLSLATIGDRVAMGERQVAIGRFLTATISGQLLGGAGAGLVADAASWRGVFWIAAAISFAATIAIAVGFRRASGTGGRFSLAVAGERYRRILGLGRARALYAFVFVEGILVFGVLPYLAPLLEEAGLGGPTQAGLIIAGFAVGGIVYTLIVRWLLGLLGLGRLLKLGGIATAGAFVCLAPSLAWPFQAAAMFVLGLGFYMLHNSYQTQVTEVVPEARASAVALHAFSFFIGQALGPILFGGLLALLGRGAALPVCAVGLLALGYVSSRILAPGQPRPL